MVSVSRLRYIYRSIRRPALRTPLTRRQILIPIRKLSIRNLPDRKFYMITGSAGMIDLSGLRDINVSIFFCLIIFQLHTDKCTLPDLFLNLPGQFSKKWNIDLQFISQLKINAANLLHCKLIL